MKYIKSRKIGKEKYEVTFNIDIDDLDTMSYMALIDHVKEDQEDHWWYSALRGKMLIVYHELEKVFKN